MCGREGLSLCFSSTDTHRPGVQDGCMCQGRERLMRVHDGDPLPDDDVPKDREVAVQRRPGVGLEEGLDGGIVDLQAVRELVERRVAELPRQGLRAWVQQGAGLRGPQSIDMACR